MIKSIEDNIDSGYRMIPTVCLAAAQTIARELLLLSKWYIKPDHVAPRADRRYLNKHLVRLATLQCDLLTRRVKNSREIAVRMAAANIFWPAIDHQLWLDRQGY